MSISEERWEQGSEFHWIGSIDSVRGSALSPWGGREISFGSGRDALRALSRFGRDIIGWKRLFVPSFLCQEVVGAMVGEGLSVASYPDDPRRAVDAPCPETGEALLVVNTFGVRSRWTHPAGCSGTIIEDHTHDPWSEWARTSDADYCIASMRKTLPVPDGGVLWSPEGRSLPGQPKLTDVHHAAAARKLEAMLLKKLYLDGGKVVKESFRDLAVTGEEEIVAGEISAMSPVSVTLVKNIEPVSWRNRRRRNHAYLTAALRTLTELDIIEPQDRDSCPFSVVLVCPDRVFRDRLRQQLIHRRIYAAILWSLEFCVVAVPEESVALSRRVLSLHCDGRYGEADMDRVAEAVRECLA